VTFGGLNTAGGAVTLVGPTTVESLTFNQFTGTYTLGASGQTITLNGGINKTSTSAAVTFASPITLGGDQAWMNNSSGALTTANGTNLITNNGYQLTVDGTGTNNFGVINNSAVTLAGSGALVKNGTGRLNVGGLNAGFSGSVAINGGVLQVYNDPGALGSGNLALNGGVLSFYWGTIYTRTLGSGTNQVMILGGESGFAGAGTSGPSVSLGTTVVWGAAGEGSATGNFNPGKFVLGDAGTTNAGVTTFSSGIDLNGATRTIMAPKGLNVAGNVSTISGAITGTGAAGLIKEGDGTLILSAANTFTGNTTISGGVLRIGNNTAGTLNSGNYAGNISVASGAILQIWSSAAQTLSGIISGAGGLNKAYGGALTLSGPNTYTGRTSFLPQTTAGFTVNITSFNSVNGGTPLLANSSLGAPTTIANGTIDIGDGGKQAGVNLTYTGPGETTDRVINFGFNGTASQTISASGSGLLKFTSAMTGNAITTQSGALILSGTGSGEITQTLPVLPNGGLSKSGNGTWTLGGANSYTGPTAISAGKLFINGNQSSATGNVSVTSGATLGGSGAIGGHTTIASGGKLEFEISTAQGSHNPLDLVAGKDFTFSGTSTLTITSAGGASPGIYTLITGGNNIIGSAPGTLVLPANWAATVSISGNSLLLNVTSTGATYAVTYNANSATSGTVPSSQTKNHDVSLALALNSGGLARTGYSFAGWNTLANGQGTSYAEGASYTTNAALTLYAKWTMLPYTSWVSGTFTNTFTDTALTANPDGDSLTNLQEFAFGTDPTASVLSPISFDSGGAVNSTGVPKLMNFAATGQAADFRAVFGRRKDHVAAGLNYAVHFSADMTMWTASGTTPSVLTGAVNPSDIEAVSVPYPATVPVTGGGAAQPPKFFKVLVTQN
jgi:fibronectin-binding autotransporter adhesin